MTRRPGVKNDHCANCGSSHLMSWRNDHVVICEVCGTNHAWPRSGAFYRGGYVRGAQDEPRDERVTGFGI